MRRLREVVDWKFLLATAFLMLVVQMGFNSWSDAQTNESLVAQIKRDRAAEAAKDAEASRERQRLVEGQEQLRRDYQLLLDYLESEGVAVPPNLARAITLGSSGRDDDDDGDTNITVRPQTSGGSTSAPSSPSPSPSGSSDDPDVVEDWTDQIGGTVEDTRKMTKDTIKDLTDNLGEIVEAP